MLKLDRFPTKPTAKRSRFTADSLKISGTIPKKYFRAFPYVHHFFVASKAPIRSQPSTIFKKWCTIMNRKFHRKLSKKEINYAQRLKMDFSSFQNYSTRTDFLNFQSCKNINKIFVLKVNNRNTAIITGLSILLVFLE